MPEYLGQDVGQEFLDMILRVYKQGYEAAHPQHQPPAGDDVAILTGLEDTLCMGGPDADALGRYLANPPVIGQANFASGQAWPKEGWPAPA